MGSKGAIASHQCGLGFKFRCLHPERFFSRHPVSPSSQKPIFPSSNLTRGQVDEEPLVKVLPLNHYRYLFIYFIYKLYREIQQRTNQLLILFLWSFNLSFFTFSCRPIPAAVSLSNSPVYTLNVAW